MFVLQLYWLLLLYCNCCWKVFCYSSFLSLLWLLSRPPTKNRVNLWSQQRRRCRHWQLDTHIEKKVDMMLVHWTLDFFGFPFIFLISSLLKPKFTTLHRHRPKEKVTPLAALRLFCTSVQEMLSPSSSMLRKYYQKYTPTIVKVSLSSHRSPSYCYLYCVKEGYFAAAAAVTEGDWRHLKGYWVSSGENL